jgi:hypothetical protein
MNEFLQTHTWLAHMDFWWCVKAAMILMIVAIGAWVLLWCLCVIVSSRIAAYQQRAVRRRRVQDYRVGSVCTPQVTRAWLAAMRERN